MGLAVWRVEILQIGSEAYSTCDYLQSFSATVTGIPSFHPVGEVEMSR